MNADMRLMGFALVEQVSIIHVAVIGPVRADFKGDNYVSIN